jgi:hypothetical protein
MGSTLFSKIFTHFWAGISFSWLLWFLFFLVGRGETCLRESTAYYQSLRDWWFFHTRGNGISFHWPQFKLPILSFFISILRHSLWNWWFFANTLGGNCFPLLSPTQFPQLSASQLSTTHFPKLSSLYIVCKVFKIFCLENEWYHNSNDFRPLNK